MTNSQVIEAWCMGRAGASGHMSTNGRLLFSYALLIGRTLGTDKRTGCKVVKRYTAPKHFVSMTTSHHVGEACYAADVIVDEWEELGHEWV